jgi:hypothetical protein
MYDCSINVKLVREQYTTETEPVLIIHNQSPVTNNPASDFGKQNVST